MDLEDIVARARAARSFTHPLEGGRITISLLLPTPHDAEVVAVRNRLAPDGTPDGAALVRSTRQLLEQSIVGWEGVTVRDIMPPGMAVEPEEASAAAVHAPVTVAMLLDAQPKWQLALSDALYGRMAERNKARDTAAKNSNGASPGKSPARRRRS